MIATSADLSLNQLRRILRDTERALGPNASTVQVLRRAVEAKRAVEMRKATAGKGAARA